MRRAPRFLLALAGVAFLAGCASLGIDDALKSTNTSASQFTGGNLELSRSDEQQKARAALSQELLSRPLSQDDAVRLGLFAWPHLHDDASSLVADTANQMSRFDPGTRNFATPEGLGCNCVRRGGIVI